MRVKIYYSSGSLYMATLEDQRNECRQNWGRCCSLVWFLWNRCKIVPMGPVRVVSHIFEDKMFIGLNLSLLHASCCVILAQSSNIIYLKAILQFTYDLFSAAANFSCLRERKKINVLHDSLALEVARTATLVNFDSGEFHTAIPPLAIAFNCLWSTVDFVLFVVSNRKTSNLNEHKIYY